MRQFEFEIKVVSWWELAIHISMELAHKRSTAISGLSDWGQSTVESAVVCILAEI